MRLVTLLLLTATLVHAAIAPEKIEHVRRLIQSRKFSEAESTARALVAAHPREAAAHALLGSVRFFKGEGEEAVKAFEKAVELAPANSEYHRQLGDSYGLTAQQANVLFKMGWGKKCRLAYEKSVELDPANLAARSSLLMFYQMAPAIAGGGMDKAYDQAAAIKKHDVSRGHVAYAQLYTSEKKFAEAWNELESALKATPDHYPALFQFGRLSVLTGERLERGMDALKKCLALPPSPNAPGHDAAHWRLGNLWEKRGDRIAARAAYQAALAVTPGYQPAVDALKKLE